MAEPPQNTSDQDARDEADGSPQSVLQTPDAETQPAPEPIATKTKPTEKATITKGADIEAEQDGIKTLRQPALAIPEAQINPANEDAHKDNFKTALANVYSQHPQLNAQREALKATDETVSQSISGFRPTATAGYSQGRVHSDGSNGVGMTNSVTEKSLDIVQPIFNGGGTLAGMKSAKERVKAGRAQLTAVEQQVLLNAIVAYSDVVNRQAVLQVNQNNVDLLNQQLKATQSRFDVGQLTSTDVAQSQSRLATAQAAERQALGNLESSRATFKRVVGYEPPANIELPPEPDNLPETLQEALEHAQANEPTLEAARKLEKAAASDINISTSTILPSVNLQGTALRHTNPAVNINRSSDAIMMNLSIPLYQAGAEWSRLRQTQDVAQQAKFNTMNTRDAVIESVTRAWQDYNTAKAVIASNMEAVRAANTALNNIRQENQYGVRTILDVLNTQQDMFTTQVNLVNARVAEKQVAYRLLAAIGRLTAQSLKLPVDINDPKQHYNDVKYKLIGY